MNKSLEAKRLTVSGSKQQQNSMEQRDHAWEQREKHALPCRVQLLRLESSLEHLCLVGFGGIEQQRLRGIPPTLGLGGLS